MSRLRLLLISLLKPVGIVALAFILPLPGNAAEPSATEAYRLSGPLTHDNLAVYFVHGDSRQGPVPLTLQEALEKKTVEVRETGRVNELEVMNTGDEAVYIQSGDIVKGGRQDRVLTASMLLPPGSGATPIAVYCVEQNRWSGRAGESAVTFGSANALLPSRAAKLAMRAPRPGDDRADGGSVLARQEVVWAGVVAIQS